MSAQRSTTADGGSTPQHDAPPANPEGPTGGASEHHGEPDATTRTPSQSAQSKDSAVPNEAHRHKAKRFEPSDRQVERFMALFPPSDIGFYVAKPTGNVDERGKRLCGYNTVRRPATREDYRRHLRGEMILTMPPLNRDGTANFGAIDVDDRSLDQAARARAASPAFTDDGCNLLHVRSLSGGGHDYLLLRTPYDAQGVIYTCERYAQALGDPEAIEIFPKQVETGADSWPNGIKLPMSGGDYSECIGYDHHGDPLPTLDAFLLYAETKRIDIEDTGGVDAVDEADEPRGRKTRALTRRRTPKQNEGRNGFLFSLACKERAKGTPEDEALALVLDLNAKADPNDHPNFSEGPLGERDVRAMVRRVYRRYPEGSESVTDDPEELVARLNEEIAVIPLGGDLRILWEKRPDGLLGEERYSNRHQRPVEYLKVSAARGLLAPYSCVVSEGRRPVKRSAFDVWYESPKRREYDGLVFAPGREREREVGSRTYNLFRGWCVEPRAGSCELQVRHVRDVLADGDPEVAHFILSFLADIVQHPGDKMPVALALIGESGTGKSALGEMMKRILGQHMFTVSDPAHVSGRFNKHLATLLLLHAEEGAIWAGDPSAVGKLRDFVSRQTMPLESKGVDTVEIESHARLLLTTEDEQAVRASRRERRFACFRVSDAKRGKREYFRELFAEITGEAGTAAFLHFLLHYKYDRDAVLRSVPETEILNDQKLASMKPQETWLQDLLDSGFLPGDWEGTGASPTYVVFDHYVRHTGKLGKIHRGGATSLGKFLKEALAGRVRKSEVTRGQKRMNFYYFPSLEEARAEFDRYMSRGRREWGSPTTWIANGQDDASGDDRDLGEANDWSGGGDDLP